MVRLREKIVKFHISPFQIKFQSSGFSLYEIETRIPSPDYSKGWGDGTANEVSSGFNLEIFKMISKEGFRKRNWNFPNLALKNRKFNVSVTIISLGNLCSVYHFRVIFIPAQSSTKNILNKNIIFLGSFIDDLK